MFTDQAHQLCDNVINPVIPFSGFRKNRLEELFKNVTNCRR